MKMVALFGFELHQALGLDISKPRTTRATQNLTSLASHLGGHASFAIVVVGTDRPHEVLSMVEVRKERGLFQGSY